MKIDLKKIDNTHHEKRLYVLKNFRRHSENRYFTKTGFGFEIYFDSYEHEIQKIEKEAEEKNRR